jgi:hypothetical protein
MKTIARAHLVFCLLISMATLRAAERTAAKEAAAEERGAVLAVVQKFFDAMAAADADALRSTSLPSFQFHAVRSDLKGAAVSRRTLDEFATQIAASKARLLERMWDATVLVHDRIAMVWAPYDFHRDGKFTHSGIDVFTLARTDAGAGWKILDLAFTVEPGVPSQHPAGPPAAGAKK